MCGEAISSNEYLGVGKVTEFRVGAWWMVCMQLSLSTTTTTREATEEAEACLQLQIKSKATQLSITTGSIRWRLPLCLGTTMVSKELCLLTTSKTPTRVHQGELQPPIQISAGTVGLVSIGGAA